MMTLFSLSYSMMRNIVNSMPEDIAYSFPFVSYFNPAKMYSDESGKPNMAQCVHEILALVRVIA